MSDTTRDLVAQRTLALREAVEIIVTGATTDDPSIRALLLDTADALDLAATTLASLLPSSIPADGGAP